jgi:hypothetical protein
MGGRHPEADMFKHGCQAAQLNGPNEAMISDGPVSQH